MQSNQLLENLDGRRKATQHMKLFQWKWVTNCLSLQCHLYSVSYATPLGGLLCQKCWSKSSNATQNMKLYKCYKRGGKSKETVSSSNEAKDV